MGCENFSVYKQSTRTTSSIEAYNGVLGKCIKSNDNFFKFTKAIRNEEFFKSRQFASLVECGGLSKKRRTKSIITANRIKEATDLLDSGKLSVSAFLSRMVHSSHGICTGMVPIENIFEESPDSQENVDDENTAEMTTTNERECVVCQNKIANVVMLPCKHLKICTSCKERLLIDSNEFRCPYCRTTVESCIDVFI